MSTDKTSIQISKELHKELKKRALAEDMRYSDYLEKLIKDQWKQRGVKNGSNSAGK